MSDRNGSAPAPSAPPPSDPAERPRIVVLTAPSGAGKSTIADRVLEREPRLSFSVSVTTRAPRPGETPGEDYYFISQDDFEARRDAGDLLEYEEVYSGRYYGTLASEVEAKARAGGVLLVLDVRGALHVKTRYGDDALVLFIAPPSMSVLARRLRARATESDAAVAERLTRAEVEMTYATRCDAIVVNDDLDEAVEETLAHVRAFIHG
jgi:guanylate kinase